MFGDTFLKGTKYFQDTRAKVGKMDKLDSFFNSFGGWWEGFQYM